MDMSEGAEEGEQEKSEISEVEGESDIETKSKIESDESEIEDDIASTNSNDIKVDFQQSDDNMSQESGESDIEEESGESSQEETPEAVPISKV